MSKRNLQDTPSLQMSIQTTKSVSKNWKGGREYINLKIDVWGGYSIYC